MLAGCIAAAICAALLFAIYMARSAIVKGQIAEGIAAVTVGAFYFSVAGGIDGAWIGALVGGVSWLVPGAHWVRGVFGGIVGAIAGAAILTLRFTVNSGELHPGLFVICFVVFGAVSAGVASAIVGYVSVRDRTPLNARAMP